MNGKESQMIKRLFKIIKDRYYMWRFRSYTHPDPYQCGSLKFIWGIKSYDDLTSQNCNLYTMNDLDITYDEEEKVYTFGIETIYQFNNGSDDEKTYIKSLFDKMTEWVGTQGIDTTRGLSLYQAFGSVGCDGKFKSLEELYMTFKLMVLGFCG